MRAAAKASLAAAERHVTPRRAVASVVGAAAVLLAVSQFVEYSAVAAGVPAYAEVEPVASPPEIESAPAGSAHAYLLLPAALVALVALTFALRRRWQLGRVIVAIGLATVAVSLLVDLPAGLDEGTAARDFEGAEARLGAGFYVQIAAGAVLAVGGAMIARYQRLASSARTRPRRRPRQRRRPAPIERANA